MPKTSVSYIRMIGARQGGWNTTGIKVEQGDRIRFANASGSMQPWAEGPVYGPSGAAREEPWSESLYNTESFCELVGEIRNHALQSQKFGLGGRSTRIEAEISGEIHLGINDGVNWDDNVGPGYTVEITLPQEMFLLIPPVRPLCLSSSLTTSPDWFTLVRDYASHQRSQAQLGVDYTVSMDTPSFNTGSYTDPLTRLPENLLKRRVTSMTHGIITSVFREEPTVDGGVPRWEGETHGITIEVLTWYAPPSNVAAPEAYYVIQYTHVFPSFGTFPKLVEQPDLNSIYAVRERYLSLHPREEQVSVATGPFISAGDELGAYAMIGRASVGPHLHIAMARYQSRSMPVVNAEGRPEFAGDSEFALWLRNPFGESQIDPELYVPGATYS